MSKKNVNYLYILKLVDDRPVLLILVIILSFLITLGGWALGLLIQDIVERVNGLSKPTTFEIFLAGVFLVLTFRLLISLIKDSLQVRISQHIQLKLGEKYINHVFLLPVLFFNNKHFTEAYARFRELTVLKNVINTIIFALGFEIITMLISSAYILYANFQLFLVLAFFQPLLFIVVLKISHKVKDYYAKAMEHGCDVAEKFHDGLLSPGIIKTMAVEKKIISRIETSYQSELKNESKAEILQNLAQQINFFISSLAQVVFLWVGYRQVTAGTLEIGTLLFLYFLATLILQPVERLSGLGTALQEAIVALERFEDTLHHEKENYNPTGQVLETVNGEIRLENVTFGYEPDRPVLKEISLSIPSNSVVAIIGESGSGKTTLANLLAGVYPPTSGKIYVDNTDLLSCNLESYRTKIGYIPQNSILFANTIQENIAVFRDGISKEQIVESAKIACADNFIDQLPLQYDTEIMNRGAGLSGGQIQRIAIARALINNPPILIMDEATSNLDLITEEAVLNAIHQRRRATTTIIIAHRLNTIKQADKIIILSNGKIVEEGTHQSLIQLDGFYTSMLKRQTGDVFTEV